MGTEVLYCCDDVGHPVVIHVRHATPRRDACESAATRRDSRVTSVEQSVCCRPGSQAVVSLSLSSLLYVDVVNVLARVCVCECAKLFTGYIQVFIV